MRPAQLLLLAGAVCLGPAPSAAQAARSASAPDVFEASVEDLQAALAAGRATSVQLVDAYLARIAAYDQRGPRLNAVIRLNPDARAQAAALDAERRAGRVRGPLHGIPIILKDNYDTRDMPTAASSVALAGLVPPEDAFQVRRLREAGAVILGKSNMHELAAGITTISSLGGQTRNPYDPRRNPGGSSGGSGAAVAASFAALAWGSDTCGSIRIPSAFHALFGLRPTKGLSSIAGIIPLAHTQDVGGPLARTVRDLAIGLDATVGPDPDDPATRVLEGRSPPGFVEALEGATLEGVRLGVLRSYFGDGPEDEEVASVVRDAVERMEERGAEVVDVMVAGLDEVVARAGVIPFEFRFDLMDYLATRPGAPVRSLTEILDKGLHHVALENTFRARDTVRSRDSEAYLAALARRDSARALVERALDAYRIDALVYPTVRRKPALIGEPQRGSTCQLSAVTGLPTLTMPAGFTPDGLPVGVELLGRALDDARLVSVAYAWEHAERPRRPPSTTPSLLEGSPGFTVDARGEGGLRVRASLTWEAPARALRYTVRVDGIPAGRVHAVTLDRGTPEKPGPTLVHLGGPGGAALDAAVELGETERGELLDGGLYLSVFTADAPSGAFRTRVVMERPGAGRASHEQGGRPPPTPAESTPTREVP